MDARVEAYFLRIMKGEINDRKARIWKFVLAIFSKIYGLFIEVRNILYQRLIFRQEHLGCIVISIGNLTVGGTGKTPIVEMLAKAFQKGGRKVSILSRGYKRKKQFWLTKLIKKRKYSLLTDVISDGEKILLNSRDSGDEPFMLAKNLKGVSVLVDKNRVRSGSLAINKFSSDIILLDDGFQYLKLGRRHDILLIDALNPFGYNHVLPRGILREKIKNLKRAGLIILTKIEKVTSTFELKEIILKIKPDATILECYHSPRYFRDLKTEEEYPIDIIKGKKVSVFSAIANPEGFEDTIRNLGAHIESYHRYRDHHRFKTRELKEVVLSARENNVDYIVTTEKDSVRIPEINWKGKKVLYLRVEIRLVMGEKEFKHFIADICYN